MRLNLFNRVLVGLCFGLIAGHVHSEIITATCYSPQGPRVDYMGKSVSQGADGYSGANPTFFFTSKDPKYLVESWQATLPFPEMITRERVDQILPPSVSKSIVMFKSESVIHAVSMEGRDAFSTTLYLQNGFGIFTRVRVDKGGLTDHPMGALYTAKCSIKVLP